MLFMNIAANRRADLSGGPKNRIHGKILVVEDEESLRVFLSRLISRAGMTPLDAPDGETALKMMEREPPDVLISDIMLPGMDGLKLLEKAKELDASLAVVLMTGHAEIRGAVDAMRAGAHDYLAKPLDEGETIRVILRALAERELKQTLALLSSEIHKSSLRDVMGKSEPITRLISDVDRVANSDFCIVIQGETGAGKEVVARAIHHCSPRSKGPFTPVDCGAIPEELFESELFGYEKGAFTGAIAQHIGKFEAAQGGTFFLDEISNLSLSSQAKLLRALQDKVICRLGSTKPIPVDVRLLVASNRDLQALALSGVFRQDLFFRLNEFTINVPPLRERKEDIFILAKRFLDLTNYELKKEVREFTSTAIEALVQYNWPGNVRQLRSTVRRAVLLADDVITTEHLNLKEAELVGELVPSIEEFGEELSLKKIVQKTVMKVERETIIRALKKTGGNKAKAARLLQADYKTIHTKIKEYGIRTEKPEFTSIGQEEALGQPRK